MVGTENLVVSAGRGDPGIVNFDHRVAPPEVLLHKPEPLGHVAWEPVNQLLLDCRQICEDNPKRVSAFHCTRDNGGGGGGGGGFR